jgi:hypothetical protein
VYAEGLLAVLRANGWSVGEAGFGRWIQVDISRDGTARSASGLTREEAYTGACLLAGLIDATGRVVQPAPVGR